MVLLKQGPWRKFTEQGRFGAAFPGEGLAGGEGQVGEEREEVVLYRFEGLGGDEDDRRGGLRGGRRREGSVRRRRLSGEGIGGMFVPMSFARPRRSQL